MYDLQTSATLQIASGIDISWVQSQAGPPLFSDADQLAQPNEPRTRIIKDILYVGDWEIGGRSGKPKTWRVTVDTLRVFANEYAAARANGEVSNLYWGSSTDGDQHDIVPRNAIAPIEKLFVANDRLWAVIYVDPKTDNELRNPAFRVSGEFVANYTDGKKNSHPLFVKHVAIVDHPTVTGQMPFMRLSNQTEETPPVIDNVEEPMADTVTLEQVRDEITKGLANAMPSINKTITDGITAAVSGLGDTVVARMSQMSKLSAAETDYRARVAKLFSANIIDAGQQTTLLANGAKAEWDGGALDIFESMGARLSNESGKGGGRKPGANESADPQGDLMAKNGIDARFRCDKPHGALPAPKT